MEPATAAAGQLVVASDIRYTLFRRALLLLDEVHAGLEDFRFGAGRPADGSSVSGPGTNLALVLAHQGPSIDPIDTGALVPHSGADPLERVLATFVQGRTNTARRAVDAVAQVHSEIDSILSSFEREYSPVPVSTDSQGRQQEVSFAAVTGQPSEEVLRMAAATTSAAARFRVRAAEAAKSALQMYDTAAKQAATAAQATTQALEMQVLAEQQSAAGNLPQALDAIRQATRLRDESADASRNSRQLQHEYTRHRREAQEAHAQADAAMRHAYSLEREALRSSTEAAARQHALWKDRYDQLSRQADDLSAQAASREAEADAAVARAEQAQQQADMQMAAGNYDLGNALMEEAVRSQELAGYSRAQATAARDALQRLMPDVNSARERMEEAEQQMHELSQRQTHLQDATAKQRKDRLQAEADELAALCSAAEGATAMHEELVRAYEERLARDRQNYDALSSEGRTAEADALAVRISTWQEQLDVARQNLDMSRIEADHMRTRLLELSTEDVSEEPVSALEEGPPEEFLQLRGAKDREARATQAVTILARELASNVSLGPAAGGAGATNDGLLLQTEMHHQRVARLAQQMHTERQRLEDGDALAIEEGHSGNGQAEALLDSMAVSHLVGTLETTRLLQLWKQRSDQAAASAEEMRKTWAALEQQASAKADEAVRLEEQALALEHAGCTDEAASTMAQAEELHRLAEQLRLEADNAKAALTVREKAAGDAQTQARFLVQGLHDVEHAAERLQSELGLRGYSVGVQPGVNAPTISALEQVSSQHPQMATRVYAPLDGAAATQDETATVMMASPSMLSRTSSTVAMNGNAVLGANEMSRALDASSSGNDGGRACDGLDMKLSSSFWATATRDQLPTRESERVPTTAANPWLVATGSGLLRSSGSMGRVDNIQRHDARLARLVQELESHVAVEVPAMPACRWEGHEALAAARQAIAVDEVALLAASSSASLLQEQVRDCASLADLQLRRDQERQLRWQQLVATLLPDLDASVMHVADRTSRRCAAVAAASSLAENALALQAKCHDELISGVSSYRLALFSQRTAEQNARSAQAEAAALRLQAQNAQRLDSELLQQVQHLQDQLAAFEWQGSTAQALTARYELQRLQNRQEEAAAQAHQYQSVYEVAHERAEEARIKEVEARANVQALNRLVGTLADAAHEAGVGAQHALDGYNHAISALALGAQVDLALLGVGNVDDAGVSDADVQQHLNRHADYTFHAQQFLAATRRLQNLADARSPPETGQVNAVEARAVHERESGSLSGQSSFAAGSQNGAGPGQLQAAHSVQATAIGRRAASNPVSQSSLGSTASTAPPSTEPSVASDRQQVIFLPSSMSKAGKDDDAGKFTGSSYFGIGGQMSGSVQELRSAFGTRSAQAIAGSRPSGGNPWLQSSPGSAPSATLFGSAPSAPPDGQSMVSAPTSCAKIAYDHKSREITGRASYASGSHFGSRPGELYGVLGTHTAHSIATSTPSTGNPWLQPAPASASTLPLPGTLSSVQSGRQPMINLPVTQSHDSGSLTGRPSFSAGSQLSGGSDQLHGAHSAQALTANRPSTDTPLLLSLPGSASSRTLPDVLPPVSPGRQPISSLPAARDDELGGLGGPSSSNHTGGAEQFRSAYGSQSGPATGGGRHAMNPLPQSIRGSTFSTTMLATPQSVATSKQPALGPSTSTTKDVESSVAYLPSAGLSEIAMTALPGNSAQAVMAIETELAGLRTRHQRQLEEMCSMSNDDKIKADEMDRLAVLRELEAQLHEAEERLEAVRAQQGSLCDASPAEVQASYDNLQFHEHRVAMLQQALQACDELSTTRSAMASTREAVDLADLEAQHCDNTLSLLAKAAEMCSMAAREMQLQTLDVRDQAGPGLQQHLAFVQEKSADIAKRQQQVQSEADNAQSRRRQLIEQLAEEESAVQLREEWLQQARKAADAASATMAWDVRLNAARSELQQLEAPLSELQDKAKAASSLAQAMTSNAAQHRKQAVDLSRQAAQQREDARRMAASGHQLEADAATAVADILQQQADGLLVEAGQMEDDARELTAEARQLDQAAEHARVRATAQAEVLEQVSAAHQHSVSVLQWNRTAANKLYDASQKQAVAAQQQLALAEVEKELSTMEAQMSGSSGGGVLRPDELATHMINVVRAKQQASRMRASLRAAQQQLDQDRTAAVAAVRQATRAEGLCTQLEPRIRELEQQAQANAASVAVMDPRPTPVIEHAHDPAVGTTPYTNSPYAERDTGLHAVPADATVSPLGRGVAASATESQQQHIVSIPSFVRDGSNLPLRVSPVHPASDSTSGSIELNGYTAASKGGRESTVLGNTPLADGVHDSRDVAGGIRGLQLSRSIGTLPSHTERSRPSNSTRSGILLSATVNDPRLKQGEGGIIENFPLLADSRAANAVDTNSSGALGSSHIMSVIDATQGGVVKTPLARLCIGVKHQLSAFGIPSPASSVITGTGTSAQLSPHGSPVMPSYMPSCITLARNGLQEAQFDRTHSQPSSPSTLDGSRAFNLASIPAERQNSQRSHSILQIGTLRNPERTDNQAAGTAGALLDRVAGRSLRPLSHMKIAKAADKITAQRQEAQDSWASEAVGRRDTSASGIEGGWSDDVGQNGKHGIKSDTVHSSYDDDQEEDADTEPDTKMYRTVKQRLVELEGRILALRRQGETASTGMEILGRKQDQLRMDMSAARGADEEQQAALLDHGDAILRLNEAEAFLCHKQADLLEDEAGACRDAIQYAIIDWHRRRELRRLETRCAVLIGKAQAKANEAQGFDADVVDATECIMLATSRADRQSSAYTATLEQQNLARFIDEQQERLKVARRRAADSRAEAAQVAAIAKGLFARKLLSEKTSLCNKALYQSAVDLADAHDQSAKIAAQAHHYRMLGMKAASDALGERVQLLNGGTVASPGYHGLPAALSQTKSRRSMPIGSRPGQHPPEVLESIAHMSAEVGNSIQLYLEEIVGGSSDAITVLRRRMDQISMLMQLYQASFDSGDHLVDAIALVTNEDASPQQQPLSETAKRAGRITAAQNAVRDLDRACAFASELRIMSVEAAALHGAIYDTRAEPNAIRAQLLGQKAATLTVDQEEVVKQLQRLAVLEVEVSLTRDQLSVALQVVDYRQASAQLIEAQQDLHYASIIASGAVSGLESKVAVHRESLAMARNHMNTVIQEARIFTASGNLLQAAAAEEAAQRLAKDALAAEMSLDGMLQEAQLKRDEQFLAGAAADELQQVAEGSSELTGLLLRIVDLQHEARVVSRHVNDLGGESNRLEKEAKSKRHLADSALKQAEQLQHESLQCRTNLKFNAADAYLVEARQCRASAQELATAAAAAQQAAIATTRQCKASTVRQDQLLREVRLLHTAAGHLQDALSCMRDKHHLVRKLRDVEYHHRHGRQPDEFSRSSSAVQVPEIDVLQMQIDASNSTTKHHLASKASCVLAADHLHLAAASLHRVGMCSSQAEAAMQELMKARMAAAASGKGASVPLLTNGHSGETGGVVALQSSFSDLALFQRNVSEDKENPQLITPATVDLMASLDTNSTGWQLHHAELRYRCLRGSLHVLEAVAVAAERASEARWHQVHLSDQAASLVSDLAGKILEAEANADEAAGLEAAMRTAATVIDDEGEENLKAKLMVTALLQKAETYRGEAAALQGRIKELEQQERAAADGAAELEAALGRLQSNHRYTLEALELIERIGQCREQEVALQSQAQTLSSELTQLDREATGMEGKTAQLRQQLTNASHSACSEDVANVMLVMQQMASKALAHREHRQQRRLELEDNESEGGRLADDVTLMTQRAEHILHASETQEQVQQLSTRITQLQSDLSAAEASCDECSRMLDELRRQYEQLSSTQLDSSRASDVRPTMAFASARQTQQVATTQAAIALAEQMLETHIQRVKVMQAAVAAWEAAKQRQEAVLRHQEQLMQQAEWHIRLTRRQVELRTAAAEHAEKARQLRASADKCSRSTAMLLTGQRDSLECTNQGTSGVDAVSTVRSQAATIRAASEAAHHHGLAEAEDSLASRAAELALEVERHIDRLVAASELVHPMHERLSQVASASMSVARLQLVGVGVCSNQGSELTTMHDALASVRGLAGRIQGLLEAADRHVRAGNSMEAAAARGQATAVQEALQRDLKVVRSCRQRLAELETTMQDAKQELCLAENRMAQVIRTAAVAQSVTEYVHRACELRYECAERQRGTLRLLRLAAEAMERAEVARREHKASQDAAEQLTQAGKVRSAIEVERAALALKRSLTEAEVQRRLLDAQAVQEADACMSEVAAAGLYSDLAALSVELLRHMDELDAHQDEHERLNDNLDTMRRSLEALNILLVHRRSEMQSLGGQIEAHRLEAQLSSEMGNDAQARVRQDAADMLTSQLADIADDVMKLEARCTQLDQRQTVLSSLHAKSEARMGLLSHLARLCSAAIGHLLDARDAHDSHAAYIREAAVSAVELSKEETALLDAEARVRELREPISRLQHQAAEGSELLPSDADRQDPGKVLQAANLAQAELLLSQRQRVKSEQQVLESRSRSAQAELAVQSSQLRITKARKRAEDAQRLVGNILALLDGSAALAINQEALQGTLGTALGATTEAITGARLSSDALSTNTIDTSHQHGVLAAAQLHSVTLQALAEAASKVMQALDCAAAAENARSSALVSAQKAQAARDGAERQQALVVELQRSAEGANVAQQVQRLHGRRVGKREYPASRNNLGSHLDPLSTGGSCRDGLTWFASFDAVTASAAQDATAAADVELERLQHEAAYLEATAAQEQKMVSCLEQQDRLLCRASESFLDMARFGIAAELDTSPSMTTDEATSLLAACKQLSQQHVTTLMLAPSLDCCMQAEACLQASLDCVQKARRAREQALGRRLDMLGTTSGSSAHVLATSRSCGERTVPNSSRSPRRNGMAESAGPLDTTPLYPTAKEDQDAATAVLLAEHDQLLAEEERMLQQVQQLDSTAAQLLDESTAHGEAFNLQWAETSRPPPSIRRIEHVKDESFMPAAISLSQVEADATCRTLTSSRLEGRWSHANRSNGIQVTTEVDLAPDEPLAILSTADVPSRLLSGLQLQHDWNKYHFQDDRLQILGYNATPTISLSGVAEEPKLHDGQGSVADGITSTSLDAPLDLLPSADKPSGEPVMHQHASRVSHEEPRSRTDIGDGDIDADLVAMAAATVARAKAAATVLASRSSSRAEGPQSSFPHEPIEQVGAFTALVPSTSSASTPDPRTAAHSPARPPFNATAAGLVAADEGSSILSDTQRLEAAPSTLASSTTRPERKVASGTRDVDNTPGVNRPPVLPTPASAPGSAVGADGHEGEWSLPGGDASSTSSTLAPPSSSGMGLSLPAALKRTTTRAQPFTGEMFLGLDQKYGEGSAPLEAAGGVPRAIKPVTTTHVEPATRVKPASARQPPMETVKPITAAQPEALVMERLPLPDDLDPATASVLLDMWSTAALHYQRAQHMHESFMQHLERQWQRCHAQLQMLQAEELKAHSGGRLVEAEAVSTAATKWQQRVRHLDAAMERHRVGLSRQKAMAHRATVMGERLHLLAAASTCTLASPEVSAALEEASELLRHLVPRLPHCMVAACGVVQSLERLHGELVQQVAALQATVAGLQQQSQRLFSKASRRSGKLKVRFGALEDAAAHAAAMMKSQSAAEQSAALGERAVELAAQARTLQELAERLSAESTQCSRTLECLQRASEQELASHQELVQAMNLLLCEAMQAAVFGWRDSSIAIGGLGKLQGRQPVASTGFSVQSAEPTGDFDRLLRAGHPRGVCLSAARAHARRGEELAQEAARGVQSAKEHLELQMVPYARSMDEAAAAVCAIASEWAIQQKLLQAQVDAAQLSVARARSKMVAQHATGDAAAAKKYSRAAEGWVKQVEKLRRDAMAASAAAEEMLSRAQMLVSLAPRLRPMQAILDGYLDQQLEAWASAALSKIQPWGLVG